MRYNLKGRTRCVTYYLIICLVPLLAARTVYAQPNINTADRAALASPLIVLAPVLSTSVTVTSIQSARHVELTDTTDNRANPYIRYVTPRQCQQAAYRLTRLYWRDKRPDTVVYAPSTDSVPAMAVQGARECGARFSIASVLPRDLLDLAQLYLIAGQDSLANIAFDRLLNSEGYQGTDTHGWTLRLIVGALLEARPSRVSRAQYYLDQLDAIGTEVALWRMLAHTEFAQYSLSVDSVSKSLAEGTAALNASAQMSQNDRIDWAYAILSAYGALADPTAVAKTGPSAVALMDSSKMDLLPLRPVDSQDQSYLNSGIMAARYPYTIWGLAASPLDVSHWYKTNDTTSTRPAPGIVSMIVFVGHACGGMCYPTYATLRRVYDRFHDKPFQIILTGQTVGYYRNRLEQPSAESDSASRYFAEFLALPGVIAFDETPFTKQADGRRVNKATPTMKAYSRGRNAILVGKDGGIRFVMNAVPEREATIVREIEEALR